jgi:hypothetical protein
LNNEINDTQAYVDEINKIKAEAEKLHGFTHSHYKNILDNLTKTHETELKENTSGDFSKIDDKNVGYYNYKNEIIFYGEFTDGFYKDGILMRKEGEDFNIYFGHFELVENTQKFNGIFLPGKGGICVLGSIVKDEVDGIVLFLKDDKIEQINKGKLVGNKKEGDNITIRIDDSTLFSSNFTYYLKRQLIHNGEIVFRLLKDNIYLKSEGKDMIYYNNNKSIYVGSIDENYNRKGEGVYHIISENITVTGKFDGDSIADAVVTNKDNFVIFKGKFTDNMMSEGVYHFSEKERFEGTFEQGKKKKGIYYYSNDTTYEGEWTDDKKVGKGIYTNEKGETKEISY